MLVLGIGITLKDIAGYEIANYNLQCLRCLYICIFDDSVQ